MGAVHHTTELACVDEKDPSAAVAVFVIFLVAGKKPEACGNLRRIEELAGQGDHTVYEIGFDDVLSDFTLARLVRRHRAVREDKTCKPVRREMVDDVLHPGEVGVADGWFAELPAFVVAQTVAAPIGYVERWVGEDEVGFEIRMAVIVKRVAVGDLAVDATQRQIHFR